MTSTKAHYTIIPEATSNAAGSTTIGIVVDLTTKYGALVTIKLTNGGTGPTIAPIAYVYISGDNVNFKLFYKIAGDITALSVNEYSVEIPPPAMYLRVDVGANTGQAVTCEAFAQVLTGI